MTPGAVLGAILIAPVVCARAGGEDSLLLARATRLAHEITIIDTHLDVPGRLHHKWQDISGRTAGGDFDYERACAGGLGVPFMAIYVPPELEGTGTAKPYADTLIAMVHSWAARWPSKFTLARSTGDVLARRDDGRILLAMGMENGSPIEHDLSNIRYFYDRGIRYITLAHGKSNHICDSSYDEKRPWGGLSPFGARVVEEMNRVGIMVDVSHISDSAFYQVMRVTRAPVIASHSSCRFFTPGYERNMNDDMIRVLAAHDGVIQINFGSEFLVDAIHRQTDQSEHAISSYLADHGLAALDSAGRAFTRQYRRLHPVRHATVEDVVRHIDHVVNLVGIDHVGLGSDFDGLGDTLPTGLSDVSEYPTLIAALLQHGYKEDDIRKICGAKLLRVWKEVEDLARRASE